VKVYKGGFTCLHCKIQEVIDNHVWIGDISSRKKKWMVIKDLLNVLLDLRYKVFK